MIEAIKDFFYDGGNVRSCCCYLRIILRNNQQIQQMAQEWMQNQVSLQTTYL